MVIGNYGYSLIIRAIGTWAILQGIAINIGGVARWSNPAYDIANLMPGSPFTWGVILFVGGGLIMYGSLTDRKIKLPNFTYIQPTIGLVDDDHLWIKKKRVLIDWNSQQFRNAGLKIVGAWLFLFGLAFLAIVFRLDDIGLLSGTRDILFSLICIILTKVKESK